MAMVEKKIFHENRVTVHTKHRVVKWDNQFFALKHSVDQASTKER